MRVTLLALLGLIAVAQADDLAKKTTSTKRKTSTTKKRSTSTTRASASSTKTSSSVSATATFKASPKKPIDSLAFGPSLAWTYDWVSTDRGYAAQGGRAQYSPMLRSFISDAQWKSDAQAAIAAGATYIFSSNEPDITGQDDSTPLQIATRWNNSILPLRSSTVKLVAPCVSNGGGANAQGVGNWLTSAYKANLGKPIIFNEFMWVGGSNHSGFLQEIVPWLEAQPYIIRYAPNGVIDEYPFVNRTTGTLTDLGRAYAAA